MASGEQRQGDVEWLAFQYAAGELHGAELDAFEQLLATDLAACEALAKAVTLCQVVALSEHQVVAESRTEPICTERAVEVRSVTPDRQAPGRQVTIQRPAIGTTRGAWALVCSAVCLALMASWMGSGPIGPRGPLDSQTPVDVAALWIQGADPLSESSVDVAARTGESIDESEFPEAPDSAVGVAELDADDDDAVPGWMLAAVAERQRELGEDPEEEVMQD